MKAPPNCCPPTSTSRCRTQRASGADSPAAGWAGSATTARAGFTADVSDGASDDTAIPPSLWLRVDRFVAFDHGSRTAWVVAPASEIDAFAALVSGWADAPTPLVAPAPVRTAVERHTAREYEDLIGDCRSAIRAGDAYQLCLTTRFTVEDPMIDPVQTYLRLRTATPAHHGGFIRSGRMALLSASPERFLEARDATVRTRPIKGTRPRGTDDEEDARLAAELLASPKERAENVMIVDLMRNDLQRVCAPGSVVVESLLAVESYPAVHQLVSTVAGRLLPGVTIGELLAATFPAGSMTGAPKISAMSILHRLEGGPRGLFAGCFGWIGAHGSLDLAMVIRSIVVHPGGAYVGAGGGITWSSEAAAEVAEVAVKARGPLAALGASVPVGW